MLRLKDAKDLIKAVVIMDTKNSFEKHTILQSIWEDKVWLLTENANTVSYDFELMFKSKLTDYFTETMVKNIIKQLATKVKIT